MRASRTFEPKVQHVADARRFATDVLRAEGRGTGDVPLLVSELATNAVLHARSDFTVQVDFDGERARVEVLDRNPRLPAVAAVTSEAYSGRGLMLVQSLSSAWGVETHPGDGKTIWFEVSGLPLAERPAPRQDHP